MVLAMGRPMGTVVTLGPTSWTRCQVVNVVLAVSQTVVVGDDLAAAANGQVTQSGTNAILTADEAVTTGAGATALIRAIPKQA